MNVLVLGADLHVGARLVALLRQAPWAQVTGATVRGPARRGGPLRLDTPAALAQALVDTDAVVDCSAPDPAWRPDEVRGLAHAAQEAGSPRMVFLSGIAVYGHRHAVAHEHTDAPRVLGRRGRALLAAERHVGDYAATGAQAVVLRPGHVWGPGSDEGVHRLAEALRCGRLGDLGPAGDGWSNLVHVDDVCAAAMRAVQLPPAPGAVRTYNLAAPDSPRWNEYFIDLALAIGATPVRRLRQVPMRLRAALGALLQSWLGEPLISPQMLRTWRQHLKLDARAATRDLRLHWTPYPTALHEAATWYLRQARSREHRRRMPSLHPPAR